MEANSTVKSNLISWNSADTLDNIDIPVICSICKVNEGNLFDIINVQKMVQGWVLSLNVQGVLSLWHFTCLYATLM